eukprot:TRINITY_DN30115_c0_g1_i4.p1 TRINITY_DN30115_c0_g1~~TRINITY_DN30115_c0_g1_i4.p1  ORF type:complete len:356 (+),score=76.82 TRINITY_DN30115_c0_g1_i4:62-1069(+)
MPSRRKKAADRDDSPAGAEEAAAREGRFEPKTRKPQETNAQSAKQPAASKKGSAVLNKSAWTSAVQQWAELPEAARQRLLDETAYASRASLALKAVRSACGGKLQQEALPSAFRELLAELRTAALACAEAHVSMLGVADTSEASHRALAKHGDQQRALLFARRAVQLASSAADAVDADAGATRKAAKSAKASSPALISALEDSEAAAKQCLAAVSERVSVAASTCGASVFDALASVTVVAARGKTAPGRLRAVDALFCAHFDWHLESLGKRPLIVDLGFGETPVTTLDLAETLSRALERRLPRTSELRVKLLGVEADRSRAQAAGCWLASAETTP